MKREEQILQINIINWFKKEFSEYEKDIYHFANERKCSIIQGIQLKKMGVRKGVADLFIAVPKNNKCGLWIELKVGKNTVSDEQMEFLQRQVTNGYAAFICRTLQEATLIITEYICFDKAAPSQEFLI